MISWGGERKGVGKPDCDQPLVCSGLVCNVFSFFFEVLKQMDNQIPEKTKRRAFTVS